MPSARRASRREVGLAHRKWKAPHVKRDRLAGWIVPAIVVSFRVTGCAQSWTAFPVIGFLDGGLFSSPIDGRGRWRWRDLLPRGLEPADDISHARE